jgi:hypothetical protein
MGCGRTQSSAPATRPVAPAANSANAAAGDIPDTQLFVRYNSPFGYSVLTPEGWTRRIHGSSVTFVWNFDGERIVKLNGQLRTSSAVAQTIRDFSAVRDVTTKPDRLPGGPATLITFTSDSTPDPVTGKHVRLDNASYVFVRNRRSARLDLWAPRGSDNVDQWNKLSRSFAWR